MRKQKKNEDDAEDENSEGSDKDDDVTLERKIKDLNKEIGTSKGASDKLKKLCEQYDLEYNWSKRKELIKAIAKKSI